MCDQGCPSTLGVCPSWAASAASGTAGRVGWWLQGWLQGKVPSGGTFPTADPWHSISPSFSAMGHQWPNQGTSGFHCLWGLSKPAVPSLTGTGNVSLSGHGKPRPKGKEKTQHWNPLCGVTPQTCQKWICSNVVADQIARSQEPLKIVTKHLLLQVLMGSETKVSRDVWRKCSYFLQRVFPGHKRSMFGVEKWITSL